MSEKPPHSNDNNEAPIVFVNPVLNKQIGLKEKHVHEGKKARKSLSEGGTTYVPKVFEGDEPSAPLKPESVKEYKEQMRETVMAYDVETQMQKTREYIRALEEEAKTSTLKLLGPFAPMRSLEDRILDAEARIRELENKKKAIQLKGPLSPTVANDNEPETEPVKRFQKAKENFELNMQGRAKKLDSGSRGLLTKLGSMRSVRGALAALGLFTATGVAAMEGAPQKSTAPVSIPHESPHAPAPEKFAPLTATIKQGGYADELFADMQKQLQKFAHKSDAPELIKHMLQIKHAHSFSRGYGFASSDGKSSRIMHVGDKLMLTDHQLIFQDARTLKQHVILDAREAEPGKPIPIHKLTDKLYPTHQAIHQAAHHTQPNYHVRSVHHESHFIPHSEKPAPQAYKTTDELNREQKALDGVPIAQTSQPAVEKPTATRVEQAPSTAPVANENSIQTPEAKTFVNAHHIEIDPNAAEIYVDDNGRYIGYGGTFDMRFKVAKTYVEKHPSTMVIFDASFTDTGTGEHVAKVGGMASDASGKVSLIPGSMTDDKGNDMPIPDPNSFVKVVDLG